MAKPNFRLTITHPFDQAQALERVRTLLTRVRTSFAEHITTLQEEWNDNIGAFHITLKGMVFTGAIEVLAGEIRVTGTLPLMALMFKGRIEQEITRRAQELFAA